MKQTRNFWPLGIILAFALFIPSTIGLVVMACLHKDELVSRDYYEQEIRYQRHLDQATRTQPLPASILFDNSQQVLQVVLPPGHVRQGLKGQIQLYRPSDASLDRELPLAPNSLGQQSIDTQNMRSGLWKIRVQWNVNHQDYLLEQKIVLGEKALSNV